MDFALSDEQRALASTVRDVITERFDLDAVRRVVDDPDGDGHPLELWKSFGEQGWLAVLVPEEHDGLGLGMLDAQVVARALGSGVVPGPWLPTVLVGEAIRLAGSPEQQARWLPRLASAEAVGALALWQPVTSSGDGRVSGSLSPVEYAGVADVLVVSDGTRLALVDPRGDGVTITSLRQYDGTVRLARVTLDQAAAEPLATGPDDAIAQVTARGAVLSAADLAGTAREALRRTIAYDKDRVQFGRPVGSFQAIKHDLADLHVAVTMAEHASLFSAYALDAGLPDATLSVHVAKSKASDTAKEVTRAMIQYHGGIGYTWEHEAHFFLKRAKRVAAAWGDAASHREAIGRLVIDGEGGAPLQAQPGTASGIGESEVATASDAGLAGAPAGA